MRLLISMTIMLGCFELLQAQTVSFSSLPKNMQLYPRDLDSNTASVVVAGVVETAGYDDVVVTVYEEGVRLPMQSQGLVYGIGGAPFSFSQSITAALISYNFEVSVVQGVITTLVTSVADVVAGDVLLVQGQSNARAKRRTGASANANQGPFLRSFGTPSASAATVTSDAAWHLAEGDLDFNNPGPVGQWALRMGRSIIDNYGIPVAILNGGEGGQPIAYFQRNDSNPVDTSTNYGRFLWQVRTAGVREAARAILWYQGESDAANAVGHEAGFIALHSDWLEDFPNVEEIVVCQVRPGCVSPTLDLRDRQRRLGDNTNLIVTVMSTMGLNGHDGCHYIYADGYEALGVRTFNLLARDLYGAPDNPTIDPPNVARAVFADAANREIILELRDSATRVTFDTGAEADFLVEGSGATVTSGSATGNTVRLILSEGAPDHVYLGYNGHAGAGAWVTNSAGVGLLAFRGVPVELAPGSPLPFCETFEPTGGMAGALGSLNDQNNWHASPPGGAQVQTNVAYKGVQSCRLDSVSASHRFSGTAKKTQLTFATQLQPSTVNEWKPPADVTAAFFLGTNQHLVAFSNDTPVEIISTSLAPATWTVFRVLCDYDQHLWSLWQDGALVVDQFPFYSTTGSGLSNFEIISTIENAPAYFDDLSIMPPTTGIMIEIR